MTEKKKQLERVDESFNIRLDFIFKFRTKERRKGEAF